MKNYKIIELSDKYALEFTEGVFEGILFYYDRVAFKEIIEEDRAELTFEYHILDGEPYDLAVFKQVIGDILLDLIEEGVQNNNNIYSGGVDEDRNDDFEGDDA